MDKKYQVFVSSTYQDLIEERQKVIEALISKNCFPVGMEYFPAANEEQFAVIKKLIDRCDYYILILGGRYGSIEPNSGKSYTQLEYEYALEKNIPIAAFYHNNIGQLTSDKVETTENGRTKLQEFKTSVQSKLCKPWSESYELAFKVNATLDFMFENYPRTGWVKADEISSAEANKELISLRKENDLLKSKIKALSSHVPEGTEKYKQGEDKFTINYYKTIDKNHSFRNEYNKEFSWNEIFLSIAYLLFNPTTDEQIRDALERKLLGRDVNNSYIIFEDDFVSILVQLMALKLITNDTIRNKDVYSYWILTEYGKNLAIELKAQKK